MGAAVRPPFDSSRLLDLAEDPNWLATLAEAVAPDLDSSLHGVSGHQPFRRFVIDPDVEAFLSGGRNEEIGAKVVH